MSDGRKYYCVCDSNCKFETMTKEQILTAITQAVKTGSIGDCDTGFITKVKEKNGGKHVTFWVGTQAQYNAIETKEKNCLYIITDDTLRADLLNALENAATAAAAAATAAASVKAIDITEQVTLTETDRPSGVTEVRIHRKKFKYVPSMGAVFFEFNFDYKGKFGLYDNFVFELGGGYAPEYEYPLPMPCKGNLYYAEISFGELCVSTREAYDTEDTRSDVIMSGWYFCDGE